MEVNELNDFRNAKIGEPVTSIRYGKGVIVDYGNDINMIYVNFVIGFKMFPYSLDGYYAQTEKHPDLYKGHGHFDIIFVSDTVKEIPIITKLIYRPYTKFVDLTGKKVISNSNETRLILESNRNGTYTLPEGNYDAKFLFDYFTFEDGTPCGELVEDNI